jgi:hypothetical protein
MPIYIITLASNQVEIPAKIKILAKSVEEAQEVGNQLVQEYNNLGNDHSTGWAVDSIIETTSPPESQP